MVELKNCSLVTWSNTYTYICKDNWICHNKVGRQQWYLVAEPADSSIEIEEKPYLLRLYISDMKEVGSFSSEDQTYKGGIDSITLTESSPQIYLEGKVFPIREGGRLILNGKSPLLVSELKKKTISTTYM